MARVKIAIYTIALNEEKHVKRWYESSKEADYHIIADTGSTDQTVDIAKSLGINCYLISIKPWRFDDARNAALALVPSDVDYCIIMDMDEILMPGWREELQRIYDISNGNLLRPKHLLSTDYDSEGKPIVQFYANRIHTRNGYRWRYPIHEGLYPYPDPFENFIDSTLQMEHHPDNSKSRDQYLDMLEMAHKESPTDSRMLYYYGRELYFKGCFEDATKIFNEYLKYSTFIEEKSSAYRILSKCDPDNAESHLVNAIDTFRCRESVIDLADYYRVTSQWEKCIDKANEGLDIVDDINTFRSEREAWGHLPYDLLALSSWNLELWEDSYNYGLTAVDKCNNENDRQRLENNLSFYAERKNTWQQRSENLQTK